LRYHNFNLSVRSVARFKYSLAPVITILVGCSLLRGQVIYDFSVYEPSR